MGPKVNGKKDYVRKTVNVQIKQEIIEEDWRSVKSKALGCEHGLPQFTFPTTVQLFVLYLFIIHQCFY
jgi:menaquinone-dependent protoporphyrinogen IX oxidase